jgi:biotin carboxyl carrier protein
MSQYILKINGTEYRAEVRELTPDQARVVVNGTEHTVDLVEIGRGKAAGVEIRRPARDRSASVSSAGTLPPPPAGRHGNVRAPLPGLILELKIREGAVVKAGDPLLVLEAMKMENVVQAPHNGTIRKIFVDEGDSVGEGDPLLELARPEMTTL